MSIYYAALNATDPKVKAMAADINHASMPVGPVGRPTEMGLAFVAMVFKYSKYPNAAKEYLRFMWEKEQYGAWLEASLGFVGQPLKAYEQNPVWTSDPKRLRLSGCGQAHAAERLARFAGPLVGGRDGRLHRRRHGGAGRLRFHVRRGCGDSRPSAAPSATIASRSVLSLTS